jgi:predicted phosphodiesterase
VRIVHLSDIHIWRYTSNPLHLIGKRAIGVAELLGGRARKFRLERLGAVIDRVIDLDPDHLLITGDLTTTALRKEFEQARRSLAPLLNDPARVTVIPGNHDRYTGQSVRSRAFERYFGEFGGSRFPWLRPLDAQTAILGLDATRAHLSARGRLPQTQLTEARALIDGANRPRRLIVACHYPLAAPSPYEQELHHKRMSNAGIVAAWLAEIGPHIYCCGHVHAAWAFTPEAVPGQLCLNSGAPLLRDPTGLRPPGFLEIDLTEQSVSVVHHAWTGQEWSIAPMVEALSLAAPG